MKLRIFFVMLIVGSTLIFLGFQLPPVRVKHDGTRLWIYEKGIFHIAPVPPQVALSRGKILSADLRDHFLKVAVTSDAQCYDRSISEAPFNVSGVQVILLRRQK